MCREGRVNYEVEARIAPVERKATNTAKATQALQNDWSDLQDQLRMNSSKVMALQDSVAKVADDRQHVEDTVRQVRVGLCIAQFSGLGCSAMVRHTSHVRCLGGLLCVGTFHVLQLSNDAKENDSWLRDVDNRLRALDRDTHQTAGQVADLQGRADELATSDDVRELAQQVIAPLKAQVETAAVAEVQRAADRLDDQVRQSLAQQQRDAGARDEEQQGQLRQALERLQDLERQVATEHAARARAEDGMAGLQDQVDRALARVAELQAEADRRGRDWAGKHDDASRAFEALPELRKSVTDQDHAHAQEWEAAMDELNDGVRRVEHERQQLAAARARVEEKETELMEKQRKLDRDANKAARAQDEERFRLQQEHQNVARLKQELEGQVASLKNTARDVDREKARVAEREADAREALERAERKQQKAHQAEQAVAAAEREMADQTRALRAKQAEVDAQADDVARLQAIVDAKTRQAGDQLAAANELRGQLEERAREVARQEDELAAAKAALDAAGATTRGGPPSWEVDRAAVDEALAQARRDVAELQDRADALGSKARRQGEELRETKDAAAHAERAAKKLATKNKALEEALATAQAERDAAAARARAAEGQRDALNAEADTLRRGLNAERTKARHAGAEAEELRPVAEEALARKKELRAARAAARDAEARAEDAEDEAGLLRRAVQDLKQRLAQAQAEAVEAPVRASPKRGGARRAPVVLEEEDEEEAGGNGGAATGAMDPDTQARVLADLEDVRSRLGEAAREQQAAQSDAEQLAAQLDASEAARQDAEDRAAAARKEASEAKAALLDAEGRLARARNATDAAKEASGELKAAVAELRDQLRAERARAAEAEASSDAAKRAARNAVAERDDLQARLDAATDRAAVAEQQARDAAQKERDMQAQVRVATLVLCAQ